jgi:hypothetical protein
MNKTALFFKFVVTGFSVLTVLCTQAVEKRNVDIIKNNGNPFMEVRQSDSVTFFWDSPSWNPDTVQYYELFFRPIGDNLWTLLKSNIPPLANNAIVVHRSEISSGDSLFYFAVRYVTGGGIRSAYHVSLDSTAVPPGGWFLFWKKK